MLSKIVETWASGGWLMLPLFLLTVFIYYTAFELWLRLESHFLVRGRVYRLSDQEISARLDLGPVPLRQILSSCASNAEEVQRHFAEITSEFVPLINRRIRFLGIVVGIGPLMGLLGTVTGMLSTFDGMVQSRGDKFQNVVHGVSEALITTQTGLIISIPAMAILSIIVQRRNMLRRCIARLARYNTRLVLRSGCPVPSTPAGLEIPDPERTTQENRRRTQTNS